MPLFSGVVVSFKYDRSLVKATSARWGVGLRPLFPERVTVEVGLYLQNRHITTSYVIESDRRRRRYCLTGPSASALPQPHQAQQVVPSIPTSSSLGVVAGGGNALGVSWREAKRQQRACVNTQAYNQLRVGVKGNLVERRHLRRQHRMTPSTPRHWCISLCRCAFFKEMTSLFL